MEGSAESQGNAEVGKQSKQVMLSRPDAIQCSNEDVTTHFEQTGRSQHAETRRSSCTLVQMEHTSLWFKTLSQSVQTLGVPSGTRLKQGGQSNPPTASEASQAFPVLQLTLMPQFIQRLASMTFGPRLRGPTRCVCKFRNMF